MGILRVQSFWNVLSNSHRSTILMIGRSDSDYTLIVQEPHVRFM